MLIIKRVKELQNYIQKQRAKNKKIGFVPTMGALHYGHLALLEEARSEQDIVICSIFVNPAQFNEKKDLQAYPRSIEDDIYQLEAVGNDVLFLPDEKEIYPNEAVKEVDFDFENLNDSMEGAYRPGHLQGVVKVLHRFLDIIAPDAMYMGQKDYQQYLISKKLAHDFHPSTAVKMVETVREDSGLAMSSRNRRLSDEGKQIANKLNATLRTFRDQYGQKTIEELKQGLKQNLATDPNIDLEYLEVADASNLKFLEGRNYIRPAVVCIAAKVEGVRLIDNLIIS